MNIDILYGKKQAADFSGSWEDRRRVGIGAVIVWSDNKVIPYQ